MDDFTNGGDNLRDASFSYLRSERSLTRKSTSINTTSRSSFGLDHRKTIKSDHHHHQDQSEISVFGAERYFNMLTDQEDEAKIQQADHDHHLLGCGGGGGGDGAKSVANRQPGTPSACSEMSWNTRNTALLLRASSTSNINSMARASRNRSKTRLIFATLGCAGSCSDEKSVDVSNDHDQYQGRSQVREDHHHHVAVSRKKLDEEANKLSQQPNRMLVDHVEQDCGVDNGHQHGNFRYGARTTKRSEDHFAFPILSTTEEINKKRSANSTTSDHRHYLQRQDLQDPPRMSLEVFGSKTTSSKAATAADEVAINLERKLSVLTWDAIPTKPQKKVPPKGGVADRPVVNLHDQQDIDSDASSDLFEIENITVGSTASRSLCATPNNNPIGYVPSEASIEWSVVTASAVDLGFVSDYDQKKISANTSSTRRYKASKSGGGILGCKSQKSVRVAKSTYRRTPS